MLNSTGRADGWLRAEREAGRMFDMSLDLLCIAGFDGYFKRVNPAFERMLGYPAGTLLSRPFLEFVHPDDRDYTRRCIAALPAGRNLVRFENRYVRSDGSLCRLEWNCRPVPEEGVMYAAGRDVTASRRAAEEQAALRHVATLVARGAPPEQVFAAVTEEVGRLLGVDRADMCRYEPDGTFTHVVVWDARGEAAEPVERLRLGGRNASTLVFETRAPVRIDSYDDATGPAGEYARRSCFGSSAAAPINVEGRMWGLMIASARTEHSLPAGTEDRLAQFTELVATAIANAEARAELTASRRRIIAAADDARRAIQRDLHDGAQQRLVSTVVALKMARQRLGDASGPVVELVEEALAHAETANDELRELSHGILPAALSYGGLRAGIDALVSRIHLPVSVQVTGQRLPATLEATAYFIAAEALTNTVKHANARSAQIAATVEGDVLRLEVRDDGIGGARIDGSPGLLGLRDRAAALDGELHVESPAGRGTLVRAILPVPGLTPS